MNVIAMQTKIKLEKILGTYKPILWNAALISIGSIIYAVGMNGVLVPQGFLNGGLVGIAILVHYLFPAVGIGFLYFVINIPLAIIGWLNISRRFMAYTLFGICFFSLATATIYPPVPAIEDPILAVLLAGVLCGTGGGIILRSMGSAGGLDIVSVYLNKRFGFRIGAIGFAANTLVLGAGALLYDLDLTLYSIIFLFIGARVTDAVITGFNKRKSIMIISDNAQEIADTILARQGRGVTFLKGEGAFTKKEKKIIFTITSLTELPKMKELILSLDPDAFVVVNDTLEVLGKRHGKGRVY